MLPSSATTVSTTYDVTLGKTSETDGRGRTTYYDYNLAGELATVRDHNRAIVRQFRKFVAGQAVGEQTPSSATFASFKVEGSMHDGDELLLSANTSGRPDLEYSWDFGDGTKTSYSTSYSTTHRFNTGAQDRTYQVRLLIRIPAQMQEFSGTQDVLITKKPLVLTSCTAGVVAVDDCKVESPSVSTSCNPSAPTNSTAFSVLTNLPGTYTYVWEKAQPMGGYTTWETISGATSSSYVVTFIYGVGQYRCTVTGGGQVGVSEVFSIEHYSSSKDIQYPCTPK